MSFVHPVRGSRIRTSGGGPSGPDRGLLLVERPHRTRTVGFIGLGGMGSGMAHNLRSAGYDLGVHDLDRERATALEEAGASWAGSVAELAAGVDVVFTSLP